MFKFFSFRKEESSSLTDENNSFIYSQGKNLYLGKQKIQLKGVNIGGYLLQEFWMTPTEKTQKIQAELDLLQFLEQKFGEQEAKKILNIYQKNYFTESDFDNLQKLGFNLLRLPFWYRNIVDAKGRFKDKWFNLLDWFLEQAAKRKMYVLLDFQGAPGSQNGKDHSGVEAENKQEASQLFFGSQAQANQDLFLKIWQAIAQRYKDQKYLLGYDILNEPFCTYRYNSSYTESFLHNILWDLYHRAYQAIRAVDQKHLIVFQAVWDPKDLPNPQKFAWQNVMYEYHQYLFTNYENFNNQQFRSFKQKIRKILNSKHNTPILLGEFNLFKDLQAWRQALELLQEKEIHWAVWTYKVNLVKESEDFQQNKNWGLYHQYLQKINLEQASLQEIKNFYSQVGQSQANQELLEVFEKFLK